MSNLHKYKQYGLIDMLNYTSRYLDGILFTIDNPEFEKDIPYIYTHNRLRQHLKVEQNRTGRLIYIVLI